MFDQLSSLDTSRTTWKVMVRVTRMWPSVSSTNEIKGYNFILLDDNNTHVQAFAYADKWKSISKNMVEANAGVENPTFSTDVIGVVEEFERVKEIQTMYGRRDIVKFRITDGRYSHKVSCWTNLAVYTDKLFEEAVETPIIAIVTSTKLKIFKSSVQISTLPSSKVYFNLDNDLVDAMRQRIEAEGYKSPENAIAELTPVKTSHVLETISLEELATKTNMDDLKV
ncbi:hypothetical protein POM88_033921 [Heracleum sosnowskyi]|uniref:Nucleic acid-binding protein n=1 Tax=Heracleum sosnowskyi TaxID=360622 RepID=A0AAD8HKB1_9APIA|nr:hypothetical protein POM88_033921 [Heracleum sosnowskyi]